MSSTEDDTDQEEVYEIERILADDVVDGQIFYLVKWKGYDDEECTWEPVGSFTSSDSIEEYKVQKARGLNLPDEFLVILQKKMDDFQIRDRQDVYAVDEKDDYDIVLPDESLNRPSKKQKKMHDPTVVSPVSRVSTKTGALYKNGVASHVRPRSASKSTTTKFPQTAKSTAQQMVKVDTSSHDRTIKSKQAAASKAGQRFRSLSHMNNYRKKARQEPPPNLPPDKLKGVAEFGNGQQIAHILPPGHPPSLDRDVSPLFIPDTSGSGGRRAISPARSDDVSFPPAKVDHNSSANVTRPASNAIHTSSATNASDTIDALHAVDFSPMPVVSNHSTTRIDRSRTGDNGPPSVFPLAETPHRSTIRRANNGRWWYRGDIMCHFTMGKPIGDATIIHVPFHPFGSHIVRLNTESSLTLNFEPNALKRQDFDQVFQNSNFKAQAIGLINPFEDTQQAFNEFADYLEQHDSAAVFHHPDPGVNISLLLYSLNAHSWRDIGWRPARFGQPRLHLAFLPKLVPRNLSRSPIFPTSQPASLTPQLHRDTTEPTVQVPSFLSTKQSREPLSRQRTQSPSLVQEAAGLDIQSTRTPISPTDRSDAYTSLPDSPALDWTSTDASPMRMTPDSPSSVFSTTRDPRLRRKNTNPHQLRSAEPAQSSRISKASEYRHKLDFKYFTTPNNSQSKTKLDRTKARFFISFSQSHPDDSKVIQDWLERHIAPSQIYLESERYGWARFKEKAASTISVLLFHERNPNYHKLRGLGHVLSTEIPSCFSIRFRKAVGDQEDISSARVKRIFPRKAWYLITESMVVQNLDETLAIIKYFDSSKKPGYKMIMRPDIERWLVKYAAQEPDAARSDKLIDLLVLIRGLHPVPEILANPFENGHDPLSGIDKDTQSVPEEAGYIISPAVIPGYDDLSSSITTTAVGLKNLSAPQRERRDSILRSFYYCYAATNVDKTRRFLDFMNREQSKQHESFMDRKEKDNILDCGHVKFWDLEEFVSKFCQRSEKKDNHHDIARPKPAQSTIIPAAHATELP